ncbi:GNAT family N-acetyltransferase [Bradyrhizobium lablabi]|uniref:GNAT family N-acetyltransferase n=1 Tax=Bradyrhizobium lablabi TaxID=722472 RepID=UPI001BACC747|nr:GNAT family N-acetyltransferase [Bradyrhizobium lablabi]MBR1123719.1 GNAT family N-acetyltransferase [Bradyrhizobium lablabi]
MAATEDVAIVRLGVEDAAAGLVLSTEARWNQNEDDWRFFLSKGIVIGVRDDTRRLIATAALLPYSAGNAWISMVLVTESWRRRGIATRLVDSCLSTAKQMGLTSWLDATPAGATVYGPLGFAPTLELRRLRLENSGSSAEAASSLETCDPVAFAAHDARAMGFSRDALLSEFAGRPGSRMVKKGNAMALVRNGRTARHIAPLFADSPDEALALVQAIVRSERGPLLLDAVHSQSQFLEGLTGCGWNIERPFQRMRFGNAVTQATEPPFAVAGPEYG